MHECDLFPEQATPRSLVDELGAGRGKLADGQLDVRRLEREMVHARSPAREETADGSVLPRRREKLDPAVAHQERRCLHPLLGERVTVLDAGTEQPLVGRDCLVQIDDCDAEMMDAANTHPRDAIGGRETSLPLSREGAARARCRRSRTNGTRL